MIGLEIREVAITVLAHMKDHGNDITTAYESVTEFYSEQIQPYSFQEVKQYIFDHPDIQP